MALNRSAPFRELTVHESVRSFRAPSLPCLLCIIPGMRFLPWKIYTTAWVLAQHSLKLKPSPHKFFFAPLEVKPPLFAICFSHWKLKHLSLTDWFAECIICYSSCFHDTKTIWSPSCHFDFFFNFFNKVVRFHCYCFICGEDSPLTYPISSLHCRRAVWSPCLRIQTGVTNQYSCLFVRVLWQIQKLNQSTKLFLWSGCSGDCGLKRKSDHCSKRGGKKTPHTVHCNTFENISVFLKCSAKSANRSVHRKCKNTLYFNQGT